jgi:hypothetical protein
MCSNKLVGVRYVYISRIVNTGARLGLAFLPRAGNPENFVTRLAGRHTTVLGGMRRCVMVPPNGSDSRASLLSPDACYCKQNPFNKFKSSSTSKLWRARPQSRRCGYATDASPCVWIFACFCKIPTRIHPNELPLHSAPINAHCAVSLVGCSAGAD